MLCVNNDRSVTTPLNRSPLPHTTNHTQACGRVVCSTCLRHKLPVQGLRGLQKACDDCADAAQGRNTGLPLSTSVALIQRGACESISEDDDAGESILLCCLPLF